MKHLKHLKFLFTALLLLCSTMAYSSVLIDGIYYKLGTSTATVVSDDTKYTGNVVIPEVVTYEGVDYRVTSIGERAFYQCHNLKSVVIPNSVTTISFGAFQTCSKLTSVTIGNSVSAIGKSAFKWCENLSEVHINSLPAWFGITFNDEQANPLYYARKMYLNGELVTSIVVPDNITEIKPYLFEKYQLTGELVIPYGVTKIGKKAFAYGQSLASITISKTVLEIDSSFYGGKSKKFIFLGNTPPRHVNDKIFYPEADLIYVSNSSTYGFGIEYERLSSMFEVGGVRYVPLNTTECEVIDSRYNDSAANVVVDSVVTYSRRTLVVKDIKDCAFYNNDYVKRAYVNNDGYVGASAFQDCDNLAGEVVVENNGEIRKLAFNSCDAIEGVKISNNGYVGVGAFHDCDAIVNADIKNNGNIESSAFSYCGALENVNIRNNGYVGNQVFYNCDNMISANVDCLSAVKDSAFMHCLKLNNLVLGENIEYLKEAAFRNCRSLPSLDIPNYILTMGKSCFQDCQSLKKVTIGDGIKVLEDEVFRDCTSLVDMTIGVNVNTINYGAFSNCSSLPTINIPKATKLIKYYTFYYCI